MNKLEWVFSNISNNGKIVPESQRSDYLVWGTGKYGNITANLLKQMGVFPLAYVDSDKEKQGKEFYGKVIMPPEIALEKYDYAKVILAMGETHAGPLCKDLERKGICSIAIMDFLLNSIKSLSVLEIGPLHSPFFKGENVKYMDAFDADELHFIAKMHKLPTDKVPKHIDYVSPDGDWGGITDKFDVIYSSHLIEHQTDLIKHLQDVYDHVHLGGAYVLVVPDKRYCFNHFDPCTTVEDVLTAYYERRKRHSLTALLRAARATHNDVTLHWQGEHGRRQCISKEIMDKVAENYFASLHGDYIDAHEWYFTAESFRDILKGLRDLGFLKFRDIEVKDTEVGQNVFYACLRK